MGIADGMSRLPSHLMSRCFIEDAIGTDAEPLEDNDYWNQDQGDEQALQDKRIGMCDGRKGGGF